MKADLTRNTFDPLKHFSRVLTQQGRVQLDADWNEQAAILLRYLRTLAADLIGPQGGPADSSGSAPGFAIGPVTPSVQSDFRIGLGHYYVDGILCEADSTQVAIIVPSFSGNSVTVQVDHWTLDGAPFQANQYVEVFDDVEVPNVKAAFSPTVVQIANPQQAQLTLILQAASLPPLATAAAPKLRRVITYLTQPDYPVPSAQALAASTHYLVYLDVWERHITDVEDDSIREAALGGPDTATRAKVVWQVKAAQGTPATDTKTPCDNFSFNDSTFLPSLFNPNRGRLKAMAKQGSQSTNPCIVSPQSRYRGPENQLYRAEIHTGGTPWNGTSTPPAGAATFKWSRENGSVVFPVVSISTGGGTTTAVLESLGRDDRFGLQPGEWVEVQDDDYVLQNRASTLLQVQSVDPTTLTVTLSGAADPNVIQNTKTGPAKHPLVRRWDHIAGDPAEAGLQIASDGAAYIIENTWLALEDGVQIQFQPPVPNTNLPQPVVNQYLTSDYWLIPARTATGDVEWPREAGLDGQGNPTTMPIAKPPDGIDHHYAPLGVISLLDGGGVVTLQGDCRKHFGPLGTS